MYAHKRLFERSCEKVVERSFKLLLKLLLEWLLEHLKWSFFLCFDFSQDFTFLQEEKMTPLKKLSFSQKQYLGGFTLFKLACYIWQFGQRNLPQDFYRTRHCERRQVGF